MMTITERLWESFHWYDKPRSYYDPVKRDVLFYGVEKKRGRPVKNGAKKKKKK